MSFPNHNDGIPSLQLQSTAGSGQRRENVGQDGKISKQGEYKLVRHKVYTQVTTRDAAGVIVRDAIGIGGRRVVSSSEIKWNVDAAGLSNAAVSVVISVDKNNDCTITLEKPQSFKLAVTETNKQT